MNTPAKKPKKPTRIQIEKTRTILEAALDVFSKYGFRGATLDLIATAAGMSKPNLLYYFAGKEALHQALLAQLMETWLEPLQKLDATGDPLDEICAYVHRKLELARDFPRESRLFANEIIQGAPRIADSLTGQLKPLVDEKAAVIGAWARAGRIADVNPHHLIFSIWSSTQHYADFDTQINAVLGGAYPARFTDADQFLEQMFRRALTVA